jgi:hypothetical protein
MKSSDVPVRTGTSELRSAASKGQENGTPVGMAEREIRPELLRQPTMCVRRSIDIGTYPRAGGVNANYPFLLAPFGRK